MPKLHSESYGSGDTTWLASDHGIDNARTLTADAAKFASVQSAKGKIPSGYPVSLDASGKVVPFDGNTVAGHILFDQDAAHGDVAVPVLYHGTVKTALVPLDGFKAPAAQTLTTIVYL